MSCRRNEEKHRNVVSGVIYTKQFSSTESNAKLMKTTVTSAIKGKIIAGIVIISLVCSGAAVVANRNKTTGGKEPQVVGVQKGNYI